MMNKARLEAFTDAVIAIILTIMILEIKTPESFSLTSVLSDAPYVISYAVGYLFIGSAWYLHHYMFSKAHVITKHTFWCNLFWMFTTSFIPVATNWVSEGLNQRGPAIFYALVYGVWTIAYVLLSHSIIKSERKAGHKKSADDIDSMKIYRFWMEWQKYIPALIVWALILTFCPALQLVAITLFILLVGARFNKDSDKLFTE